MSIVLDFIKLILEPSPSPVPGPDSTSPSRGPVVARNTQPFWQERGWALRGEHLEGYFRTRHGAFKGVVLHAMSRHREFRIFDPPRALLSGPHGACFMARGPREFFVHWKRPPQTLDHGIRTIEQSLLEVLS